MIEKIDHLGIAVRSLDEAVPYYEKALGLKCEHREEVASQKVRTAFFTVGQVHLELLEPTGPAQRRDVVWSHPAFAHKNVYARNDKEIVSVSLAK